ncbi:hypothetical protein [Sphingobacterium multivorum]|uniref:hypothetical protein n=1 Tax=Sphingobacterium multivorum TaxID=28454 RepID=UPI0028A5B72B|nr:hypothetical protein [Sphingobacterium multivorum]
MPTHLSPYNEQGVPVGRARFDNLWLLLGYWHTIGALLGNMLKGTYFSLTSAEGAYIRIAIVNIPK